MTRKALEIALAGDSMAMPLCAERILSVCGERAVMFKQPPIATCLYNH